MTYYIPAASGPAFRSVLSGTANSFVPTNQQIRDVNNEIQLLDPNATPLVVLMKRFRTKTTNAVKPEWYEDVFPAVVTQVNDATGYTAENVITVDDGTLFRAGDMWMCSETGAVHWVASVTSNAVTFVKDVGGSNPTETTLIEDNDTLFYIGNAQEHGARARAQLSTISENKYNYVQLFKDTVYLDNTLRAIQVYGGSDEKYQIRKAGIMHMRDHERALWFGVRGIIDTNDQDSGITTAVHHMGGCFEYMSSDYSSENASSSLTEDEFDGYLKTAFRYGMGVKFHFCSPTALGVISSWGRDKLQMVPRDKTYGINISRYISPHGELNLINTKMFGDMVNQTTSSDGNTDYDLCSVILDLSELRFTTLRGTEFLMNRQENDRDGKKHEYISQVSMEFHHPEHHYLIENWVM